MIFKNLNKKLEKKKWSRKTYSTIIKIGEQASRFNKKLHQGAKSKSMTLEEYTMFKFGITPKKSVLVSRDFYELKINNFKEMKKAKNKIYKIKKRHKKVK